MDVPTKQVFTASIPRPPFDWLVPRCFGRLRIAARGVSPRATLGAPLIRSDAVSLIAWTSSRWWTPHGQQHEARNEHQAWKKERTALITRGDTVDPCHSSMRDHSRALRDCSCAIRDRSRTMRDSPFVPCMIPIRVIRHH